MNRVVAVFETRGFMEADKEQIASFTVRLPEGLRKQLIVQASAKNRSLNSHIQSVLEGHLVESGFAGHKLISRSGRTFEIVFSTDDIPDRRDGIMGFFQLNELKFDKQRAYYMIGLNHSLIRDWKIEHKEECLEQFGVALLHFYNRQMEIDHLRWTHPVPGQDYDGYKVFSWKDVAPAGSFNEFLDLLRMNQWSDPLAEDSDKSQDIRLGRNLADLYR